MNVTTQEIPKDRWRSYFDDVGKTYDGWGVTIEVLGRELGDQPAEEGLPLQGITYETAGSDAGNILIEVGDLVPAFVTHHVDRPQRVRVADAQPGAEFDIEIESDDGTITLVHLRPRPELPPRRTTT
jgi:hypothetical protein